MTSLDELARYYAEQFPHEAARVLMESDPKKAAAFLASLDPDIVSTMSSELGKSILGYYIEGLDPADFAKLAASIQPRRLVSWLRLLPVTSQESYLNALKTETKLRMKALLDFPANTAGALMDSSVAPLFEGASLQQCLESIKSSQSRALYYIYVIDKVDRLVGVLNLKELLVTDLQESDPVSSLMTKRPLAIDSKAGKSSILSHPGWQRFHALPVVDDSQRYLGVIRYEILRALESDVRATSDIGIGNDLGELYTLGLSALIEGVSRVVGEKSKGGGGSER